MNHQNRWLHTHYDDYGRAVATGFVFQMDLGIGHADLCRAIELIGREVKPLVG